MLVPGDFWIEITTAGVPESEPSPRLLAGPSCTSATCPIVTGTPSWNEITVFAISFAFVTLLCCRIGISKLPTFGKYPALAVECELPAARTTSEIVRP